MSPYDERRGSQSPAMYELSRGLRREKIGAAIASLVLDVPLPPEQPHRETMVPL